MTNHKIQMHALESLIEIQECNIKQVELAQDLFPSHEAILALPNAEEVLLRSKALWLALMMLCGHLEELIDVVQYPPTLN